VRLPEIRREGYSFFFRGFCSVLVLSPNKLLAKLDDFFCWNRVFYDDFGDCYDEIAIAGVDFISEQPIWSLYLQGGGMLL
jgi:hypothetical protein